MPSVREQSGIVLKAAARWTALLGLLGCAVALVVGPDLTFAWSIALGALAMTANFAMLTITLARSLGASDLVNEDGTPKRRIRVGMVLRMPLFLVALVGILWYMPARPQGVFLGVVIGLLAASIAALTARKANS
jgi:hypothetical protein